MDLSGTEWEITNSDSNHKYKIVFNENGVLYYPQRGVPIIKSDTFTWSFNADEVVIQLYSQTVILVGRMISDCLIEGFGRNEKRGIGWKFSATKTRDFRDLINSTWSIVVNEDKMAPIKLRFLENGELKVSNTSENNSIWSYSNSSISMKIDNGFTALSFYELPPIGRVSVGGTGKNGRLGTFNFTAYNDSKTDLIEDDIAPLLKDFRNNIDYQKFASLIKLLSDNKFINAKAVLDSIPKQAWREAINRFDSTLNSDESLMLNLFKGFVLYKNDSFIEGYKYLLKVGLEAKWTRFFILTTGTDAESEYGYLSDSFFQCKEFVAKKAIECFNLKNYQEAIQLYEILGSDDPSDQLYFLKSLVLVKYPNASLDESNCLYKEIDTLNLNYYIKQYYSVKDKITKGGKKTGLNNFYEASNNNRDLIYLKEILLMKGYTKFEPVIVAELTSEERNVINLWKGHRKNTLGFGKYKGEKINDIMTVDPDYICWCIINLTAFCVRNKDLLKQSFRNSPLFYKAAEVNIIKQELLCKWGYQSEIADTLCEALG